MKFILFEELTFWQLSLWLPSSPQNNTDPFFQNFQGSTSSDFIPRKIFAIFVKTNKQRNQNNIKQLPTILKQNLSATLGKLFVHLPGEHVHTPPPTLWGSCRCLGVPVCVFFPGKKGSSLNIYVTQLNLFYNFKISVANVKMRSVEKKIKSICLSCVEL